MTMAGDNKKRRREGGFSSDVRVYEGEPLDLKSGEWICMDRYGPIDEDLRRFVNQAATRRSWADAWQRSTRGRRPTDPLDAQASPEERLAVFQQIKASGDLPEAAGFYLVADQAKFLLICNLADQHEVDDRRIKASLGEYARLYKSRPKDDACDLRKKSPAEWDRLYLDLLLKSGEEEMVRLYIQDQVRFRELCAEGHRFFYPNAERA
jgi:hypothetical protein